MLSGWVSEAAEGWADAGLWKVWDSGPGAAFLILRLQVELELSFFFLKADQRWRCFS